MPSTFFLIPGYGAQGGKAADIAAAFDVEGNGAAVNSSRQIICAHMKGSLPFGEAARAEALRMRDELGAAGLIK
jgi:orotidine-5'-phosphate decarboxylase